MDPTTYNISQIKTEDVQFYSPDESLIVYEWYCEHCDERIGYPYIDSCNAEICDDPGHCPKSSKWNGDPCGHVVCKWCHTPATEITIKWDDGENVQTLANEIGLDEPVEFI